MKIRNGFVSNSSSSSFVVLKDAINSDQLDKILSYEKWVEFFISNDTNDILKELFEYCDDSPWNISEYEDFIFGETSMDNFNMEDYFDYIKIDKNYSKWDEGYIDEPEPKQLEFIKIKNQEYRKKKIEKLNKLK